MDKKSSTRIASNRKAPSNGQADKKKNQQWEKPTLKDVSGQIMAQPYIRFT